MNETILNELIGYGVCIKNYREIDSTNTEAKRLAVMGCDQPTLITADSQTAGKGRLGRSFYSPENTGLYMSYLYRPAVSVADSVAVTSAAAVAVVRAIKELTDLKPLIKWVNDIYIDGKKVCGILTEAVTDQKGVTSVIVGIGININTADFPEEIQSVAGSLGKTLSREELAAAVVNNLRELINGLDGRTFIEEYKSHSAVLGREVVYITQGEKHTATAVDIDNNGGLTVEDKNGNRTTLSTGEISVRLV